MFKFIKKIFCKGEDGGDGTCDQVLKSGDNVIVTAKMNGKSKTWRGSIKDVSDGTFVLKLSHTNGIASLDPDTCFCVSVPRGEKKARFQSSILETRKELGRLVVVMHAPEKIQWTVTRTRRHLRKKMDKKMEIEKGGGQGWKKARMCDISQSGLGFFASSMYKRNEIIRIRFTSNGRIVKLYAKIMWLKPGGAPMRIKGPGFRYGAEFVNLSWRDKRNISMML